MYDDAYQDKYAGLHRPKTLGRPSPDPTTSAGRCKITVADFKVLPNHEKGSQPV